MSVRSILFVFENSTNLRNISTNLKFLLDHIDYSSTDLNETINSTKFSKKIAFTSLIK